ncbi:hypothetical protein SAMN05443247_04220 [Bradyrhizobium erythrophlei]|nr:hypothetical protein SAMN05443247_04220 [Bradyrhizobium erythrophlei]
MGEQQRKRGHHGIIAAVGKSIGKMYVRISFATIGAGPYSLSAQSIRPGRAMPFRADGRSRFPRTMKRAHR